MADAIQAQCETIRKSYSPCDVSDALQTLGVSSAGYLQDISPLPSLHGQTHRIVAPISTVLFVSKNHVPSTPVAGMPTLPAASNLPPGRHWTDVAPPGSVVLMQQPPDQVVGLVGDIVATRYRSRGVKGVVVDGRVRDNAGIGALALGKGEDGSRNFTAFSRALTSVGTSLEAKPWAVDVPVKIGGVEVWAGDVMVADEGEGVCCVIPQEKLAEVVRLLPELKETDDGLLGDVQGGMGFGEAVARWPGHYSRRGH